MKLIYTIIAIALLSNITFAQEPNWLWAKSAGGNGIDHSSFIKTDASGNVYVAGWFYSLTIVFGTTTLTNANSTGNTPDIFIVKYAPNGNVLWAKSAGGYGEDGINSIAIDKSGSIYLTGWFFSPTINFGSTTLKNADNTGNTCDLDIIKYDGNGNVLWAKREGANNNNETSKSVAIDALGNVFVTGWFSGPTLLFGTTSLTNIDITGNSIDIYLVKYNTNGNVIWAKSAGGNKDEEGISLATDPSGNVYLTGGFNSPSLVLGNTILTWFNGFWSDEAYDMYIVKYDANGNVLWAKGAGGNGSDVGNSIATDALGNVYLSGYFYSPSIVLGNITLTNADPFLTYIPAYMYIVKYNANGNALWAKSGAGHGDDDYGTSIAIDASGNAYVTGWFNSFFIDFDGRILINESHNYLPNTFLVKYNANGNILWIKSGEGTRIDFGNSITVDALGNIYVTGGFFSPTIVFGSTTLTNADNTENTYDMYLAKIGNIVGTKEETYKSEINIYPNPFTSQATIKLSEEQKQATIKIFDMVGKEIKAINFTGKEVIIKKGDMQAGAYLVQIIDEKKNVLIKNILIQ